MSFPHKHRWKHTKGDLFKFCACGKRKKFGKTVKQERSSLKRKAEDLWRKIAHTRDGFGCQIQKVFPELNLPHGGPLQVDHFFPRGDHNLFFEPSNATVLCGNCNMLKSNGSTQSVLIHMAVKEIVLRREGEKKFQEMFDLHNRRTPNLEWGRRPYLESIIEKLRSDLEALETRSS